MEIKLKNRRVIAQDIKGEVGLPKETCAGCIHTLSCFTLGVPRVPERLGGDQTRHNEAGMLLEDLVYAFLTHCRRPLGALNQRNICMQYKHKYLWLTPFVPLRAKAQLLLEIVDRVLEEMHEGGTIKRSPWAAKMALLVKTVRLMHKVQKYSGSSLRVLFIQRALQNVLADLHVNYAACRDRYRTVCSQSEPIATPVGDIGSSIIYTAALAFIEFRYLTTPSNFNFVSFTTNAYATAAKFISSRTDLLAIRKERREQTNRLIELSK